MEIKDDDAMLMLDDEQKVRLLQGQIIDAQKRQIAALEKGVEAMKGTIAAVQEIVSAQNETIRNVRGENAALREIVAALTETATARQQLIDGLDREAELLRERATVVAGDAAL